MKLVTTLSVMTCALLLHANVQAAEILIDDFTTDQGPVSDTVVGGGGTSSDIAAVEALGGHRDIYVEEVDNGVPEVGDDFTQGIHAQVSNGRFSASLDNLVNGFAVVTYDGANVVGDDYAGNVDVGGLGGLDWSDTAYFLFEDVSNDLIAPVTLTVWTEDEEGIFTAHSAEFLTVGGSSEPQDGIEIRNVRDPLYDTVIYLSVFGDEYINWASVGAFQAIFNMDNSAGDSVLDVDLSLSRATLPIDIPEPAALSMFGAGMLMLGFVGTRRRKNSEN